MWLRLPNITTPSLEFPKIKWNPITVATKWCFTQTLLQDDEQKPFLSAKTSVNKRPLKLQSLWLQLPAWGIEAFSEQTNLRYMADYDLLNNKHVVQALPGQTILPSCIMKHLAFLSHRYIMYEWAYRCDRSTRCSKHTDVTDPLYTVGTHHDNHQLCSTTGICSGIHELDKTLQSVCLSQYLSVCL